MDSTITSFKFHNNLGRDVCVIIITNNLLNIKIKKDSETRNFIKNLDIKNIKKCKKECIDCCICLSSVNPNEFIRELNCNHKYHKKCIDKWLIKMSKQYETISCPICRQNIELKEILQ